MNKFAAVIALIGLVAIGLGCADDIYLEDPEPIEGVYKGEFIMIGGYSSADPVELRQPINWVFTDSSYFMSIDTAKMYAVNPAWKTCKVSGDYLLTEGVVMKQRESNPDEAAGFEVCTPNQNPQATFSIFRRPGGLELKQLAENDTLKQVILRKAEPLEKYYRGTYSLTDGGTESVQAVLFKFTDDKFQMEADTSSPAFNADWETCLSFGAYSLDGSSIEMTLETAEVDLVAGFTTCTESESPDGGFSISSRDTNDPILYDESLLVVDMQWESGGITKRIFLIERPPE